MTELASWAIIHGLATLLDGPLREIPEEMRDEMIVRSMLVLVHGLRGGGFSPEIEELLATELMSRP
jgi:hypothetical protein